MLKGKDEFPVIEMTVDEGAAAIGEAIRLVCPIAVEPLTRLANDVLQGVARKAARSRRVDARRR